MKRLFLTSLIAALCCFATTGCTFVYDMATEMYWNLDDPAPVNISETADTLCIIKYACGKTTGQQVIHSQVELDFLLYKLLTSTTKSPCTLVQSSSHTSGLAPIQAFGSQAEVKFTSPDINKVKEWAKKMLLKGYQVDIIYDRRAKTYNCTARPPVNKQ